MNAKMSQMEAVGLILALAVVIEWCINDHMRDLGGVLWGVGVAQAGCNNISNLIA